MVHSVGVSLLNRSLSLSLGLSASNGLSASIVITLLLGKGGGGKASTVERVKRVERVESHRFLRGLTCDTNIYVQLVHVRKKLFMYL